MRRGSRLLLLAAAALLAAACTRLAYLSPALAYSNATRMLTWTVDDYVGLSHPQNDWLHAHLDRAMAWHRASELPRYRRFLASVAERSGRPFSEAEVAQAWEDLRADYRRVVARVLPEAADFLATLDRRQLARLERKFADDNRKLVKESGASPGERRARATRKMIGHLEEWVGRLDEAQRGIVAEREGALPPVLEERLADRRYRQLETIALARSRDPGKIVAGLRRLLIDTDTWRRPEYRAKLEVRERATLRMIAELSATLTPAQRSHLRERIGGYMRDITRLASSG